MLVSDDIRRHKPETLTQSCLTYGPSLLTVSQYPGHLTLSLNFVFISLATTVAIIWGCNMSSSCLPPFLKLKPTGILPFEFNSCNLRIQTLACPRETVFPKSLLNSFSTSLLARMSWCGLLFQPLLVSCLFFFFKIHDLSLGEPFWSTTWLHSSPPALSPGQSPP